MVAPIEGQLYIFVAQFRKNENAVKAFREELIFLTYCETCSIRHQIPKTKIGFSSRLGVVFAKSITKLIENEDVVGAVNYIRMVNKFIAY